MAHILGKTALLGLTAFVCLAQAGQYVGSVGTTCTNSAGTVAFHPSFVRLEPAQDLDRSPDRYLKLRRMAMGTTETMFSKRTIVHPDESTTPSPKLHRIRSGREYVGAPDPSLRRTLSSESIASSAHSAPSPALNGMADGTRKSWLARNRTGRNVIAFGILGASGLYGWAKIRNATHQNLIPGPLQNVLGGNTAGHNVVKRSDGQIVESSREQWPERRGSPRLGAGLFGAGMGAIGMHMYDQDLGHDVKETFLPSSSPDKPASDHSSDDTTALHKRAPMMGSGKVLAVPLYASTLGVLGYAAHKHFSNKGTPGNGSVPAPPPTPAEKRSLINVEEDPRLQRHNEWTRPEEHLAVAKISPDRNQVKIHWNSGNVTTFNKQEAQVERQKPAPTSATHPMPTLNAHREQSMRPEPDSHVEPTPSRIQQGSWSKHSNHDDDDDDEMPYDHVSGMKSALPHKNSANASLRMRGCQSSWAFCLAVALVLMVSILVCPASAEAEINVHGAEFVSVRPCDSSRSLELRLDCVDGH